MREIYAINLTASGVEIGDLSGLYIDPYDTVNLRLFFSIDEIDHSEDLYDAITSGAIILNDGEKDLSLEESYNLSTVPTLYDIPKTFLDLDDTPTTYSGYENKAVTVNSVADGLEFVDAPVIVQDEGSNVTNTPHTTLNFIGNNIKAEDAGSGVANITVSGAVSAPFGENFYNFFEEEQESTTSTTYQEALSVNLNDLPIGSYRIGWCYEWTMSNGKFDFWGRLQVNDTDTYMEHQENPGQNNSWAATGGFVYIVHSGGNIKINIDYKSDAHNKTAKIRRKRIEIWRIS